MTLIIIISTYTTMSIFTTMRCVILCLFSCISVINGLSRPSDQSGKVKVLAEFLITVNDTWKSHGCIDTVKTPPILSGDYNNKKIPVGNCDNGPLAFQIRPGPKPYNYTLDIIFFSEVIQTAAPPTCSIKWNGAYLTPTRMDGTYSLLPGCYTTDSRDGLYKTQYWFHLLTWTFQTQ